MRENKSPWLHNFKYERDVKVLTGSQYTDICVLGGGIAGVSTAYMLLKYTDKKVILIEGDKIAHGATGHNAGYVEAEFEKPFKEIVKEYGLDRARQGKYEIDEAWNTFFHIREVLGLPALGKTKSAKAYSDMHAFVDSLQEEYLKYGKIEKEIYLSKDSDWFNKIEEHLRDKIQLVSEDELRSIIGSTNKKFQKYRAVIIDDIAVANSAHFTEELAKHCLKEYGDRFTIYEKSFVNSIRLLDNNNVILDAATGMVMADKIILCTNGFENFNIYGPLAREIDTEFHHNISGLIGYMMATFTIDKNAQECGGKFYGEKEPGVNAMDAVPYIYYTKRKFNDDILNGELISMGGPEAKLSDRRIYKKDHAFDEKIYNELEDFQKEMFNMENKATFKWHGLMGYTKSGIRIVGQDKIFSDLYFNLGCNGIGILPSIAGAKRIAQLIQGKKFEPSIFDPK